MCLDVSETTHYINLDLLLNKSNESHITAPNMKLERYQSGLNYTMIRSAHLFIFAVQDTQQ